MEQSLIFFVFNSRTAGVDSQLSHDPANGSGQQVALCQFHDSDGH